MKKYEVFAEIKTSGRCNLGELEGDNETDVRQLAKDMISNGDVDLEEIYYNINVISIDVYPVDG